MNQTHVVAGAAGVSIYPSLNLILTWLLTWPIVTPSPDTISAISALIVSGVLLGLSFLVKKPVSLPAAAGPVAGAILLLILGTVGFSGSAFAGTGTAEVLSDLGTILLVLCILAAAMTLLSWRWLSGLLRKIAIVGSFGVMLAACASTGAFSSFTPAQTAHIDYVAATAGLNDATAVAGVAGLSAADKLEIKTAGAAFEAAVEAQLSGLLTGGSITTQAESAAASATAAAAANLGKLLAAAHGSNATAEDLAVAGGLEALQQLPEVITAVVSVQNGFAPAASDLANDLAAMQAAAAKLAAS